MTEVTDKLAIAATCWRDMLAEFDAVQDRLVPWPEDYLHNGKWQVFPLRFFGVRYNVGTCPVTESLVDAIPGVVTAGFSVLHAGAVIEPHHGYTQDVMRAHIGLRCPQGAYLRVGGTQHHWRPGDFFVFDDTKLHSAANPSGEDRVILLIDYERGAEPDSGEHDD